MTAHLRQGLDEVGDALDRAEARHVEEHRGAAVRRIALAAAVRSDRVREAIASTATPRLKTGTQQQHPRLLRRRTPATVRPGGLIANPLVSIRADVPTGDATSAVRVRRFGWMRC